MSGPTSSSSLDQKNSFKEEKDKDGKSKRNIFGSLFRKKKGKYEVKPESKKEKK